MQESSNYGSSQATDAAASETFEQIIAKNAANNAGGLHEKPVVETVTEDDESETYNVHSASAAITNLGTATTNKPSHHYQQQQPPTIPSAHIGRPPRQAAGGDPPAENEQNAESASGAGYSGASVGTRLTKLGVEIGRGGHPLEDGYYSGASYSQQQRHENYSVQSEEAFSQTLGTQKAKLSDADLLQGASPNLSMVRTEDSSAVPTGYSTDYGNNESLAKQQLLAELREAEGLMAESKTAEAAKFWRDHVQELEARIAALDGEEGSTSSDPKKQLLEKVSSTDNSEKRMLAEIMNGPAGNYVPPSLNPFQANNAPSEGGSQGEQGSVREDAGRQTAPLGIDPSLEGVPMVDVVAPADLPGGYNFEAEIEGRRFLATVPAGGVQKGETFSCYMRDLDQVGSDIPVGRWRDGVFDCFSLGLCHPVICNALFCPLGKCDF